ncbi:TadE family protein [Photobacterium sp. J15]|uniref:TadE family protein n=1 Tax=Photobacterium sp. J15 TaxID=265901 RepID=UPI0007E3628C|nr:TadE family protein [Photobacterium sp. J15]
MKKSSLHLNNGLAMVEFTILLPLMLLVLLATMELGRAFYTYTSLEKSTRDSARYLSGAIVKGSTGTYTLLQTDIDNASNLAVYGSISGGTDPRLPSMATSQVNISLNNNHVLIEIIYPYQPALAQIPDLLNQGAISLNFNMTSSYSMRVL